MDVNDADAEGNSALHWCLRMSWSSSSQQIKSLSLSPYMKFFVFSLTYDCLLVARIIWLLLKNGARVNQKDKLELTAFHIAAANGNAQALQV